MKAPVSSAHSLSAGASSDPQPVVRNEPAGRTHLDRAYTLPVLATQMIEDVLRIGHAFWRRGRGAQVYKASRTTEFLRKDAQIDSQRWSNRDHPRFSMR